MSADRDDEKEKKKKRTEPRIGSVVAADEGLATWLHRLWARNERPERIEVWQMFGRNRAVRGEMVHHEDFDPKETINNERAARLANEIIEAAQNDCDGVERKQSYQIAVIDKYRKAQPLIRRLGPLQPQRIYRKVGDDEEEDEDSLLSGRSLALNYVKEANEQSRWDKQRYDRVMGELLMLMREEVVGQRAWIDGMMTRQMDFFAQLQDAKDREADRVLTRKMAEFKVTLLQDGLRTARNLLPGLFGPQGEAEEPSRALVAQKDGAPARSKNHGFSPERALVDNLLLDCENTGISVALFGDWEEKEGRLVPIEGSKPGIFTPAQFAVLVGVQSGQLPADALDALMPNSGDPKAITEEQIKQAQPLMSEGTGTALLELVGLRQRQRDAKLKKAKQQPTPIQQEQ